MSSHVDGMENDCCKKSAASCAYLVAVVGALLIVAALVWVMIHYTRPAPLGEDRANERRKALSELRANNEEILNNPNYVWQDQNKGIVRMPINRAMELALKLWADPAAARSNLTARVEKATAVAPPPSYE